MQHGVIEGHNVCLLGNGIDIHDLHAKVEQVDGWNEVTTAWIPTPDEVLRIMSGAPVYVTVLLFNNGFPPMRVGVKRS